MFIYEKISNAVYRSGFATTQTAYDQANADLISGLDRIESDLGTNGGPFLCGDAITDCDLLLLPTVLRFDKAYATLFRAGGSVRILGRRCSDYPNIDAWAKRLWFSGLRARQRAADGNVDTSTGDEVRDTIDIAAAVVSYHNSLFMLCPSGIVAGGVQTRAEAEADLGLDAPSAACLAWLDSTPVLPSRGS